MLCVEGFVPLLLLSKHPLDLRTLCVVSEMPGVLAVRTVPLAASNVAAAAEVFATVRQLGDWMGRAGRRRNLYVGMGQRMSERATLLYVLASPVGFVGLRLWSSDNAHSGYLLG